MFRIFRLFYVETMKISSQMPPLQFHFVRTIIIPAPLEMPSHRLISEQLILKVNYRPFWLHFSPSGHHPLSKVKASGTGRL